jgi:hypothetical protein
METASGKAAIIKPLTNFFIVLPSGKTGGGKNLTCMGGKDALPVQERALMFVNQDSGCWRRG